MTETQAKSGAAGASANPVDEEAADGGAPATGRAAVGRAVVPADGSSPKFTRAPGMPPPPDQPPSDSDSGSQPAGASESTAVADGSRAGADRGQPTGAGGSDRQGTGSGTGPGIGTSATGSARPAGGPPGSARTDAGNVTVPISSGGGASMGSDQQTSPGVGAQAKAAAQSVMGLARSAGLGRFTPGAGPANRPDGGSPRTAAGATRPGTARSTAAPPRPSPAPTAGGASAVGAARVTEAVRSARSTVGSAASRGPRRARLNVKRIDPWSVMKFSFAVSLVLFIVVIVATSVLYLALDAMGVFESVNSSLTDLVNANGQGTSTFKITAKGVILTSALVGLINVVLFTALATLGAFVYNVCADLVGGIELTLAERD